MKKIFKKNQIIIAALAVMIAAAGYLNYSGRIFPSGSDTEETNADLANQELLDFLQAQAKEKGCTMAQLALGWILAKRPWIVPIPGTTKLNRLEENISGADVKFTPEELRALNEKLEQIQIYGARYNAQQESMVEK